VTSSPGPSAEQIAETLRTADDHFGIERVGGYDIVEEWERTRSGNRFLRFRADPGREELLVKTGSSWTEIDARELYRAQASLADAVDAARLPGAMAIRPGGWTAQPPLLVMPFVEGTDLVTLLRDPDRPEWDYMPGWMGAAGAMLAAFHHANPARGVEEGEVLLEVEMAARKVRLRPEVVRSLLDGVDVPGFTFASYGDFGPGNLIGATSGDVFLIDPPVDPAPALAHRDLGNFLFELRRQLAGRGYTRSSPVAGRFDSLRQAFLDGYSGSLASADLGLIALFEMRRAAGMARKRLPGRPGDAIWFARSASARRREVRRLVRQPE
jgi:hypothetical protein